MSDDLAEFYVHETQVARYSGVGSTKDKYAEPVTLMGFVEDENKLIVAADGQQTVSSARIYYPAGTDTIPLKTKVTLPAPFLGRESHVIAVKTFDSGDLDLPDHIVVALL